MNEKRQVYLDSISNNIENQLMDLLLDDDEIVYIVENIKERCVDEFDEIENIIGGQYD